MTFFEKKIHRFPSTDSTNDEAAAAGRKGAPEGEVFLAEFQTRGRGRQGRAWESGEGKNLTFSILLRPRIPQSKSSLLTLVAGAALHESVACILKEPLRSTLKIKWPNDIYLGDKKISGILSEMHSQTGEGGPFFVVIGVGINVNANEDDFSLDVRTTATSLKAATGIDFDREGLLQTFLRGFEKRYEEFCGKGFEETRSYVQRQNYLNGKRIQAVEGSLTITGVAQGLSEDGALVVKAGDDRTVSIISGDIRVMK